MILCLDTSALVKLYVREAGSAQVRTWLARASAVATSVVAYAETRSAFARLHREGLAGDKRHLDRIAGLNADWESFVRIDLTASVLRLAGETAETYAVRGFDAIHLASALWLRDQMDVPFAFAAFDQRLLDGAARAGLSVLPARGTKQARAGSRLA